MLFDSHAHYTSKRFDEDRDALLASLPLRGVSYVMLAGTTLEDSRENISLAERYPHLYAAVGIYPHDCGALSLEDLDVFCSYATHEKVKALGETGLDYYYDDVPPQRQKLFFEKHLELGEALSLPVIVHDREAHQDCLDTIRRYRAKGVFHCFSGSAEFAKEVVRAGWYVSFSGSLTFKNAKKLLLAAQEVPLDRILLETDSPYLAPDPHRGERNDSTLMEWTARKLAELRGESYETICSATTENALRFFNIAR